MMKKAFDHVKQNWLFYLIIVQPLLDMLAYWQANSVGTAAGVLRLLIMIALPVHILFTCRDKKSKTKFLIAMGVMGLFSLLHIANGFRVGYINFTADVAYLLRVLQMPVLAVCFTYYIRDERMRRQVTYGFLAAGIIILVSMGIAALTGTGRYTYTQQKMGLTGWFSNANSQSLILISLAPIVLYFAVKSRYRLVQLLTPVIVFLALIINGTKACYYSIYVVFGGFFGFLILEYLVKRKDGKKLPVLALCLFAAVMVAARAGYPYTPRAQVDAAYNSSVASKEKALDKSMKKAKVKNSSAWKKLSKEEILADPKLKKQALKAYKKLLDKQMVERFGAEDVLEEYGMKPTATQLADMRFKKVVYARLIWKNSDPITKLVGFEYSQIGVEETYDVENDWPAIFYYYGYIGFALYVLFIAYFVFLVIKALIQDWKGSFTLYNFALLITLGLQLGLAQYSGSILRRPNASIYLSFILALIYYQTVRLPRAKAAETLTPPEPELPEETVLREES